MSMKPKIILTEEVVTQIMELEGKRDQMMMKRTEIEERFNTIQQVVQENAALELKSKKLIEEYKVLMEAERGRMKTHFPEIRLGILQKMVDCLGANTPPPAAAPAAGGDSSAATDSGSVSASSDAANAPGDAGGSAPTN